MVAKSQPLLSRPEGARRLFRGVVLLMALAIPVIVLLSGYGIYRVYQQHIVRSAEEEAVQLSKILIGEQRDLLFTDGPDGGSVLYVDPMYRDTLDRRLRQFLQAFHIVEIKVYDRQGRVLFSTDPAIIGEVDQDNPRLGRALAGTADSHLERKGSLRDLDRETRLDVDVVETYVPIRSAGQVVGSFEVYLDTSRYRKDIYSGVLASVLIVAAILLAFFGVFVAFMKGATQRLSAAQEKLHRLATVDALTGILNRGTILARAREEVSRIERRRQQKSGYALSFILLDIDHFKKINDTFGHLTGDQVLRELAERVRAAIRDYDLFGRYGGEEFLVILPDSPFSGTKVAAERIREAVGSRPFVFEGPVLQVTVSLGIATALEGEQDLSQVLQWADEGLYLAKDRGRNQVGWVTAPRSP